MHESGRAHSGQQSICKEFRHQSSLAYFACVQVGTLEASSYAWLGEVLQAFNNGELHRYDALCSQVGRRVSPKPGLLVASKSGSQAKCSELQRRSLSTLSIVFPRTDVEACACPQHASALNSQPALVENERALREKITILALTELIFKCVRPV